MQPQVRCMVAILILVGQGHETPDIVKRMLDVDHFGNKPQYNLADEVSLALCFSRESIQIYL